MTQVTLTNLVANASFEAGASWSGITYDGTQACFGARSQKLPIGTSVATCPMSVPIVGHTYYGRHYLKSSGNNAPADCRFEWFAGDGAGLNFVFGWNRGDWPRWGMESSVIRVDAVKGTSYVCRSFVVNGTAEMWADGLMIVDLTAAFGAGNEPEKDWCDECIPFFEGSLVLETYPFSGVTVTGVSLAPNPVQTKQAVAVSAQVQEVNALLRPVKRYCGGFYAGEE